MIQDAIDYLDADLTKVSNRNNHQKHSSMKKLSEIELNKENTANSTNKRARSVVRMPNVYVMKELPTQKAIISPRIQFTLDRSESILATRPK